jgi:hypothetical protein
MIDPSRKYANKHGVSLTAREWMEYLDEVDFESYRNVQGLYDMWNEDFTPGMKRALNEYYHKRKAMFRKTGR